MKAYSLDLRQKIINVYNTESISQRQLAKRFNVSLSFIQTLLKRYREEGTIAKKPYRGGKPRVLNAAQLEQLRQLVVENNNATLEELCKLLYQQTQIQVSRSTIGRIVQLMKLKRTKKFHTVERSSERVQKLRLKY
ncbi:helix-turn-helix domain-containing protein [Fischerella sp. PCC 9605]|uniref:helix-turn-helix domain-containing protein n=1 Tax=Fischerella sp. PCC 9605 TaxID=1173024 RepID=UPI00047E5A35|nr:helix-turn-helix domain-containing protein [Fischerella sp. PCC 9605]